MNNNGLIKIIDNARVIKGNQFYFSDKLNSVFKRVKFKRNLREIRSSFKKISYSQSGEDLIIDFLFTQMGIFNPTFIDIGAHHPFYLSNTALFYQKGCRGINIEPDPELFKLFLKSRKKAINLNCGIALQEGEMLLNIMNEPALNTFSEEEAERLVTENNSSIVKKIKVQTFSINTVINKYANNIFPDLLSLDVEGMDIEIIKSIDYNTSKPTVICVETISFSQTGNGKKDEEISKFLIKKGYMVYADTNINTIFVLKEKWLR